MAYTIDIDTGGTFTDGFFVSKRHVETVKVPTTPHDLTVCFFECIQKGADRFGIPVEDLLYDTDIIRFSNTIGTNTIIQRDGSRIGLLITAGLENLAPTQEEEQKAPLVLPDMVLGIQEEVGPAGEVVTPPNPQAVMENAQKLIDRGARCLVVAFANSEFNPGNEREVRGIIKAEYPRDFLGSIPVFLSSDISGRSGGKERINAAVINAYIHGKLVSLLYKAGEKLRQRLYQKNLFIVHNNNAVARVAKTRAINTYNSGPAAGLMGARLTGELYNAENVLSADMGGTSFDVSFVRNGVPSYTLHPDVEGFEVNLPMISIRAVGAGGGSIATVKDGILQVGPNSAGALPGPVCFGLGGTEPTVTDADLILGILSEEYFLGGSMKLNKAAAWEIIERKIAQPLGLSVEEAALAIKSNIDESMGTELQRVREVVDKEPLMVVYGGAGPTHCCNFARAAGLKRIVITPYSAVFSAFSSSNMDVGHLYYDRLDLLLTENTDFQFLEESLRKLEQEAHRDMRGEGFEPEQIRTSVELLIKGAKGQKEVKLDVPSTFYQDQASVKEALDRARNLLSDNGKIFEGEMVLSLVSLIAQAPVAHYTVKKVSVAESDVGSARKGARKVFLDASVGFKEVPVFDRNLLTHGHRLTGPAIVESGQTTVLLQEGWHLFVDEYNNVVLKEGVAS